MSTLNLNEGVSSVLSIGDSNTLLSNTTGLLSPYYVIDLLCFEPFLGTWTEFSLD